MKLWQLLAGVPLTGEPYSQEMEITSISYDTRTLLPGALFVALPGAKTDGSLYIDEALAKGAAAVVCRRRPQREGVFFTTPDPRRALALLAANWFGHPGREMTLIGVTGTNGKTTTTFLIKEMLEGALKTRVGLIGTIQNMVGERVLPAHRTTPESYEVQHEPMNGLDPDGVMLLRENLKKLVEEQAMSILISSHQLGEIEKIATRILCIDKGKMITTQDSLLNRRQYVLETEQLEKLSTLSELQRTAETYQLLNATHMMVEFVSSDGLQKLLSAAHDAGILITDVQQRVINMEEFYQQVFRRTT